MQHDMKFREVTAYETFFSSCINPWCLVLHWWGHPKFKVLIAFKIFHPSPFWLKVSFGYSSSHQVFILLFFLFFLQLEVRNIQFRLVSLLVEGNTLFYTSPSFQMLNTGQVKLKREGLKSTPMLFPGIISRKYGLLKYISEKINILQSVSMKCWKLHRSITRLLLFLFPTLFF